MIIYYLKDQNGLRNTVTLIERMKVNRGNQSMRKPLKKNEFYKGLNKDWADCYTGESKYRKGKTIKIKEDKKRAELCSDGVLHASKELHNCIAFIGPYQFCIVNGKPIITDGRKSGFFEYRVVRRMTHKEVGQILGMNFDLRPITHFFKKKKKVRKDDIKLLRTLELVTDSGSIWDSIWDNARNSIMHAIQCSVWNNVYASVWGIVWENVWGSAKDSIRDSSMNSIKGTVWEPIKESVWDAIWGASYAYLGSLFFTNRNYRFSSVVELIKRGLMPVITKMNQCILSGPDFEIVYQEFI